MYEKRKAKRLEEKSEITITIVSGGKKSPEEKIMYNQSKDISVLGARIRPIVFAHQYSPQDRFHIKNPHQMMISTLGKVKWIKSLFGE